MPSKLTEKTLYANIRKSTILSLILVLSVAKECLSYCLRGHMIIIRSMNQLKFSELMEVYAESNLLNGRELYPTLSQQAQIREAEQNFYCYLKDVFFRQSDSFYAVWACNGRYVSALRIEPYRDGVLICGLETMPCARRQGYAARLLIAVLEYLKGIDNPIVYSHVSKRNQPSLATHLKCGFHILQDYAVYSDGSVLHNHYTMVNSN